MLGSRQVILFLGKDPASTAIKHRPVDAQLLRSFEAVTDIPPESDTRF